MIRNPRARTFPTAPRCPPFSIPEGQYICRAPHYLYAKVPPTFDSQPISDLLLPPGSLNWHKRSFASMSLLHLPSELFSCISEYLDSASDLNAFAQTSHCLYRPVNSYLYRHNIQQSQSRALIWAAQNGRLGTAQKLLEQHTDDQAKKDCCVIPLFEAAGKGHDEIVKLLLDNGADIHAGRDKAGRTANLQLAPSSEPPMSPQSREALKFRQYFMDIPCDEDEWEANYTGNALYAASEGGHADTVKLLLEKGATIDTDMGRSGNAFQAAAEGGHEDIVKLLLDTGYNVHARGRCYVEESYRFCDSNALCAAAEQDHIELVKMLLELGMDVNEPGGTYGSPLQGAAANGHEQIVDIFLSTKGIDVNAQQFYISSAGESEETSPLYLASEGGHIRVVKSLLDRGVDVNARVAQWATALTVAAVSGHKEVVELLIERGADLNEDNDYGSGALEAAAQYGHEEIAELLFEAGADMEAALEGAESRKTVDCGDCCLDFLRELAAARSGA